MKIGDHIKPKSDGSACDYPTLGHALGCLEGKLIEQPIVVYEIRKLHFDGRIAEVDLVRMSLAALYSPQHAIVNLVEWTPVLL